MKKTVLALFEKRSAIDQAYREFQTRSPLNAQFQFFSNSSDPRPLANAQETCVEIDIRNPDTSLYRTLRNWNVPVNEALELTEAVCEGALLAAVTSLEDRLEDVIEIFERSGALDIDTCLQVFREHRSGQRFDDTIPPFLKIAKAATGPLQEAIGRERIRPAHRAHESVRVYEAQSERPNAALEHNLNE